MGFYINQNQKGESIPDFGKERFLIEDGAIPIPDPKEWEEGLVCIIDNHDFEAAGYAYSKNEMERFKYNDGRFKTWVKYMPASKVSGYDEANNYRNKK